MGWTLPWTFLYHQLWLCRENDHAIQPWAWNSTISPANHDGETPETGQRLSLREGNCVPCVRTHNLKFGDSWALEVPMEILECHPEGEWSAAQSDLASRLCYKYVVPLYPVVGWRLLCRLRLYPAPGRNSPFPQAMQSEHIFSTMLEPPLVQKIAVTLVCNLFTKMHAVPLLENRCCARCCRKKALKADAAPNLNEPRDPRERIPKVTQEACGRHEGWTQISWGPANAVVSGLSSLLSSSPLRQPVNEMELITPAAAPALL